MGGRAWRHAFFPYAALFVVSLPIASAVAQQAPPAIDPVSEQDYDIPAQPLARALESYAVISGVNLLYPKGLETGRRSTAIRGRLTRQAALRALLEGSGLLARFVKPKSAILFLIGTQPQVNMPTSGAPSLQLDMAEVRARPMIGGGVDAHAIQAYGDAARIEIRPLIERDPKLQHKALQLDLTIFVDADGRITNAQVGSNAVDADRVRTIVNGLKLSQPPPDRKPVWLRFVIVVNPHASPEPSAK